MPTQTKVSTGKDGRKRTYSLVSNISNAQAGPVASTKTAAYSSPSAKQAQGAKQALTTADPQPQKSEPTKQAPNVFEYLDENDESSSGSSSSSDSSESDSEESEDEEPEPRPKQVTPKIQSPTPQPKTVPHRVLAPGGNTPPKQMTQSPPAIKSPKEPAKPPAPLAPEVPSQETQLVTRKRQAARKPSPISMASISPSSGKGQMELSRPPQYHGSRDTGAIHRPPLPPSPPRSPEEGLHFTTPRKRRDSAQSTSGYGLVASQLTKSASEEMDGFSPLYRRFESVNHRVLLHLQDEISQMEEDLRSLDDYEEMHRISTAEQEGTKPLPASRRRDSQAQAYSSLHYRRMDLMSALVVKTEQYSTHTTLNSPRIITDSHLDNALTAYSKVLQTLPSAPEKDVDNYRSWMIKQHPIASAEVRFLNHRKDLVSLTPRVVTPAAAAPVYVAIIIASGALLLPLLAFNMIAEFSGRLVVVTVVGGAAAAIAANYSAGVNSAVESRDGWRCATIYFGFMTMAAMFIP
ncbi:unnamed protein product [Penicillium salamii]|uniref:DUF6594 domain-containing protein n=1 Tax=Penicillium salamii TaxID=1612424 RepID=A0A9W4I7V3_9EURO|nr:unnamed protein product [Penicillium salamii]CAG7990737.1 unnamed protein product [Penicillium salamii]CAG7998563.1 unnamed protein product [Penicillium salamii]CAG8076453.1 unnamed protein product [Penicillium salamii]CAG8252045.1 unnamed protein product [Penicillium salamii]